MATAPKRNLFGSAITILAIVIVVHFCDAPLLHALSRKSPGIMLEWSELSLISLLIMLLVLRPLLRESHLHRTIHAELSKSNTLLRSVFDSVHDAIIIHDRNGVILHVNAQTEALFGVDAQAIIGAESRASFSNPDAPVEQIPLVWAKVLDGQPQLIEWVARRQSDGTDFDIEIFLTRISFAGNDDAIMACVRDISARKHVEKALHESEEQFRTIFANAGIGIALVSPDGKPLRANPALLRMLGYAEEEFLQLTLGDFTHPDDLATDLKLFTELRQGLRDSYQMEKRYLRKDGGILWGRLTVSTINNPAGDEAFTLKMIEDITERKENEDQLRLVAKIIDNTVEGVTITDANATILSVNPAFTEITGYTAEEAIGQNPRIIRSDRHDDAFYQAMWRSLIEKGQWHGEIWNRRKSGEAYPEWLTISSIQDEHGNTTHYVAVFHDITETKQNEAQIHYQAYHDALTGLPNRQLFNDRLALSLAHAQRNQECVAIFFLDLDRFKTINDTLGHIVGDRLLQAVAKRLTKCVRQDDTVARLGGDEFTVLLGNIKFPEDVTKITQKILTNFQMAFMVDGRELFATPSIGVSVYPTDGDTADTLMKNADTALYRAKDKGRNNYQLYTPAMNARAVERLEMETDLRRAVEREEFLLHYQARVSLATETVQSLEALIRWQHPERGLTPPADFIALAEETGLIVPIGDWVLRTACAQQRAWLDAGLPPTRVAVNLSARQFQRTDLVATIDDALRHSGLAPHYLELEITESVAMEHGEQSLAMLRDLHALGVHLSIDDFGTGFSSLGYLKKFPVHALKIDQSFVRDIPDDQDDAAIAAAVIALAHTLNLQVVAEGVENAAQLAFMREHHCDDIQGFYFSEPVPAEEFARRHLTGQRMLTLKV
ncbi:MAG TPA: EAL domain-containing protein [Armatimonadota bacterium]|jgi:diguanylate cyclase (GGDEF)-like protein/PAS domain S-box-containing protein